MFERFTERARQVVVLAQEEARTLQHNYIDLGIDLDALWVALEQRRRESWPRDRRLSSASRTRVRPRAIEGHEFQSAARLRDRERELVKQARARATVGPEVAREIRRRLGLPGPDPHG